MSTKKYMGLSFAVLLSLSFYPLLMGARILAAHLRDGYIDALDYPKYVIPYTPICIALLISVALVPLSVKYCKRFALFVQSILGAGLFLLSELGFERLTVFSENGITQVDTWQRYTCHITNTPRQPIAFKDTIGTAIELRYSPAFKIHFYLIAIIIILAVLGVIHGFYKMLREDNWTKKRPLTLQAVSVSVFIGLCVFACFTAFFRTGDVYLSPLSAVLTGSFFVLFGLTAGAYAGGLLYAKRPVAVLLVPSLIAVLTTILMYAGEFVMLGLLFRFGEGFFFESGLMDCLIVALAGVLTWALLFVVRKKRSAAHSEKIK